MKANRAVLAIAVFLPALFGLFIGHNISLADTPFFLIAGFVLFSPLYFLLQKFKISKENSAKIVLLCSLIVSVFVGYSLQYSQSPEGTFKRLIGQDLPKGIEFIHKEGGSSLAGAAETLVFRLPAASYEKVIKQSFFEKCTLEEIYEQNHLWKSRLKSEFDLEPANAYRIVFDPENPSMSGIILISNEEKNLVFIYRWKI